MTAVVITGAAGFIGTALTRFALEQGSRVIAIDIRPMQLIHPALRSVVADVKDDAAAQLIQSGDVLFHLASQTEIGASFEQPIADLMVNTVGSCRLFWRAAEVGANVVFTSSAAVYGRGQIPMHEEDRTAPISPYGASKTSAEVIAGMLTRTRSLRVSIARLFNVYGPDQRKYVLFDIVRKLHADPRRLDVLGDGDQVRDWLFIDDAVEALWLLSTATPAVYNVCTGVASRVKDMVSLTCDALGIRPEIRYGGRRWEGDIDAMVGDSSKARALGFAARTPLEDGVPRAARALWSSMQTRPQS